MGVFYLTETVYNQVGRKVCIERLEKQMMSTAGYEMGPLLSYILRRSGVCQSQVKHFSFKRVTGF